VGQKIFALVSVYASADLGWAATNRLRLDLAAHCLGLDMSFHKLRTPGELIERIDGDVSSLAEAFARLVVQVFGNALLALGILVLLLVEDWRYAMIGAVYALLLVVYMRTLQDRVVRAWGGVRVAYTSLFGYMEERLVGTEDIRGNGGEPAVLAGQYPLMTAVRRARFRAWMLGMLSYNGTHLLFVFALLATLGLAGSAYLAGEITIGTVFLLAAYIALLQKPMTQIRREIDNLQRAVASTGRIGEFLALRSALPAEGTVTLPTTAPAVAFDKVSFAYRDRPGPDGEMIPTLVLQDITFALPAGRVLGLLGRTGSGKTTLTRLLFRLYDVDTGAITLDEIDLRQVRPDSLRQHIGLVTQDVQLFAATVRDNLTLFRNYDPATPPIGDSDLLAALNTLGLAEWLAGLPAGLDTELGPAGQGLSAGEAQLLALARVFLQDPQLVVLDEASSRLDPQTEQRLERALDTLLAGRTGIIIAHRLHTVQRADDILILENGRVREHGERLALAADRDSRFAGLLRTGLEEVLV
jgi:ABC-type multidrug transport system fused ATPase/permease subunit